VSRKGFLEKSLDANSLIPKMKKVLFRGSSKNIWQGSFCSISRGTKPERIKLLRSSWLKNSLSGPERDWHYIQQINLLGHSVSFYSVHP